MTEVNMQFILCSSDDVTGRFSLVSLEPIDQPIMPCVLCPLNVQFRLLGNIRLLCVLNVLITLREAIFCLSYSPLPLTACCDRWARFPHSTRSL